MKQLLLPHSRAEEGGPKRRHEVSIYSGDDRRRLIPQAIVAALTALIDAEGVAPSHVRVELRTLRSRLCRVCRVEDPSAPANSSAVAQGVADEDGDALEA